MTILGKIFRNGRNRVKEIVQEVQGVMQTDAERTSPAYKQKPIILADLLKGAGFEIETIRADVKVEKGTHIDVPQESSDASANSTYNEIVSEEEPKKTIVIIDPCFGIENKLNDYACDMKKQLRTEASLWFLYNRSLYDTYSKCKGNGIDAVILGNLDEVTGPKNGIIEIEKIVDSYEDLNIKDARARESKLKTLIANYLAKVLETPKDKIKYIEFRDLWQYSRDFSEITGLEIKIDKPESYSKPAIVRKFPKPIEADKTEEPKVKPPEDFVGFILEE